jgi:hypothetical protein
MGGEKGKNRPKDSCQKILAHPYRLLQVHPCATAEVAGLMLAAAPRSSYLLAFLSLHGRAVGCTALHCTALYCTALHMILMNFTQVGLEISGQFGLKGTDGST